MLALGRDADIAQLRPEDWLANLIIAGTVDEEAKKELMKIDNPDMEKVRKAANTHEKQQNSMKTAPGTSRAFQIKTNNTNKTITCYACGENGHKSIEFKKNKDSLKCTKCKRTGHLAKICRSKMDNGSTNTNKKETTKPGWPRQQRQKRTRTTLPSTRPGRSVSYTHLTLPTKA